MLRTRTRRNHLQVINLGPPERFINAENEDTKVEDKLAQRPASSRRPPLSVTRPVIGHGKENRYQSGTPREKTAPSNNRQTPNSTYPNSVCGSSGSINKSVNLPGGQTPSSTFPVSLPITGAPNTQDTGITEPDTFTAPEGTGQLHTSPNDEPGVETSRNCDGGRTDEISKALATSRRGSEDRGTPAVATTNPPPPPPPSVTPTNPHLLSQDPGDIVTMASGLGEKRFKRLKLLGCGGSSKVRTDDCTNQY